MVVESKDLHLMVGLGMDCAGDMGFALVGRSGKSKGRQQVFDPVPMLGGIFSLTHWFSHPTVRHSCDLPASTLTR